MRPPAFFSSNEDDFVSRGASCYPHGFICTDVTNKRSWFSLILQNRTLQNDARVFASDLRIRCVAHVRVAPRRAAPVRVAQLRVAPVRVALVRADQVRVAPIRAAQVRVAPIRVAQIRAAQERARRARRGSSFLVWVWGLFHVVQFALGCQRRFQAEKLTIAESIRVQAALDEEFLLTLDRVYH